MNPVPKIKYWRSKGYSDYVSQLRSFLTNEIDSDYDTGKSRNHPHHHRKGTGGGTSIKPSDLWQVPVTQNQHNKIGDGILVLDNLQVSRQILKQMLTYFDDPDLFYAMIEAANNYLCENDVK